MLPQRQQTGVLETIDPPWPLSNVVVQYCEKLWLNHDKIHGRIRRYHHGLSGQVFGFYLAVLAKPRLRG
jgi:hypothetical protein